MLEHLIITLDQFYLPNLLWGDNLFLGAISSRH
jgi:hypothetical protein